MEAPSRLPFAHRLCPPFGIELCEAVRVLVATTFISPAPIALNFIDTVTVLIFIGIWFVRIFRRTDVCSTVSADMDSGWDCLPVLVFFHGIHKQCGSCVYCHAHSRGDGNIISNFNCKLREGNVLVMCVSVHGGSHVTITHDALDFIIKKPPAPCTGCTAPLATSTLTGNTPPPGSDTWWPRLETC